jgi:hypothetical protein
MLNNVPAQINKSARLVTLNHPNAMDCTVHRKTYNRTDTGTMGGLPTLGGLGVLDGEDEPEYTYMELGDAKILFAGQYQAVDGNMRDDDMSLNYAAPPMEALVECVKQPTDTAFFVADKPDLVMVYPGAGIALAYEVVGVTSPSNIPPYGRKLILAPRSDLNVGI